MKPILSLIGTLTRSNCVLINNLVFSNLADAIMHIVNSPFSTNWDHA